MHIQYLFLKSSLISILFQTSGVQTGDCYTWKRLLWLKRSLSFWQGASFLCCQSCPNRAPVTCSCLEIWAQSLLGQQSLEAAGQIIVWGHSGTERRLPGKTVSSIHLGDGFGRVPDLARAPGNGETFLDLLQCTFGINNCPLCISLKPRDGSPAYVHPQIDYSHERRFSSLSSSFPFIVKNLGCERCFRVVLYCDIVSREIGEDC